MRQDYRLAQWMNASISSTNSPNRCKLPVPAPTRPMDESFQFQRQLAQWMKATSSSATAPIRLPTSARAPHRVCKHSLYVFYIPLKQSIFPRGARRFFLTFAVCLPLKHSIFPRGARRNFFTFAVCLPW